MVDAPQMIGNIPVGKVMQGVSQTANAALNQDPLVRVGTAPGRKISPEDSDVVIRIPTTPPPPSPKVINEPWHREGCIAISEALEGAQDFTAQLRGNTLIGIDEEHPFLAALRHTSEDRGWQRKNQTGSSTSPIQMLYKDSAEKPPIKPVRHSERSEESRVFQDLRPFTSFRGTFRGHSSAESYKIVRKLRKKGKMRNLKAVMEVPGMLTLNEAEYLYRLARTYPGKGVIVEIGSWTGKSTICLCLGSMAGG